jgi:hypothetical protein
MMNDLNIFIKVWFEIILNFKLIFMTNERSNAILKMKNFFDIISPFNKNRLFDCIISIDSLMKILNNHWLNRW